MESLLKQRKTNSEHQWQATTRTTAARCH